MTENQSSAPSSPDACPVCGWEYATTADDPEREREEQFHLKTFRHQASALGESGRKLVEAVRAEGERLLRKSGLIP